jgi:hypothetical protein
MACLAGVDLLRPIIREDVSTTMNRLRRLKLRELAALISDGTAVIRFIPNFEIGRISTLTSLLAGLAVGFLVLIALLVGLAWYVEPIVFVGPAAVSCGIIAGAFAWGAAQFLVRAIRTSHCLGDGRATYLMPGAFTHVLTHDLFAHHVLLVRRGLHALKRYAKNMGPRQTMKAEWVIYRGLRQLGVTAETYYVGRLAMDRVNVRFGGNLRIAALKGEERMIADRKFHEVVDVCVQERGIPLNEFLHAQPTEKAFIYPGLQSVVHRMWRHGYIDLDVALRNYMVRVDREGRPLRPGGRYQVAIHDFGSTFRFAGDCSAIERFLDSRENVAGAGRAVICNGAFLLRSLTRPRELEFAQLLLPRTPLVQLIPIFHVQEDTVDALRLRLRHHSNVPALRSAYRSIAETIVQVQAAD